MTVHHEEESEHSFMAYNESLVINKNGEKIKIVRDFEHTIIRSKEFVNLDGNLVPFHRKNFPFDIYDIEFTKNVENEELFVDGKQQTLKLVQHIQIKNVEYILLNGSYKEYSSFKPVNSGNEKNVKLRDNKKIIATVAGVVLVIFTVAIFSAFAGAYPSQDQYTSVETQPCASAAISESTPEPIIPGYFERSYSWEYNDRADRMFLGGTSSDRTYAMTISVSKNSYYRSKDLDHSSHYFSSYVNDTLNREETKTIADSILEMGKKYGFGDFENAMNAASFVQQCIPYTKDEVSTGYMDYWRYPVETLVDNGGDCEDSSILLASILQNMGYEVIVIGLHTDDRNGHAAVAIKDVLNPICGNCAQIEYNGENYLYLESTNNSEIGYIPYEYYGVNAYDDFG